MQSINEHHEHYGIFIGNKNKIFEIIKRKKGVLEKKPIHILEKTSRRGSIRRQQNI